jgi:hypothetical protein
VSLVHLRDGNVFYLPAEDAARLAELRNAGTELVDLRRFNVGIEWLDPRTITRIAAGGQPPFNRAAALPAPAVDLERRARNAAKFDAMAKNYRKRFAMGYDK